MSDEDRCCALPANHDGCCAYFCSACGGWGYCDLCDNQLDDCSSCDWCDSTGSCPDCWGHGWFNEDGEAIPTPVEMIEAGWPA